jgi:hypothetical protein
VSAKPIPTQKVVRRPALPPSVSGAKRDKEKTGKDASPTACHRFGYCVVVEQYHPRELLTVEQARELAAELIEAAKLADLTPLIGHSGMTTRQLPGEAKVGLRGDNPKPVYCAAMEG